MEAVPKLDNIQCSVAQINKPVINSNGQRRLGDTQSSMEKLIPLQQLFTYGYTALLLPCQDVTLV